MSTAWAEPVVAFFMRELPQEECGGWNHYFSTVYQVGCEALIALGQEQR